ncbi:hypothetical protein PTTG_25943, partial [Puccinia triticina 1-1 BBBD Race 1]
PRLEPGFVSADKLTATGLYRPVSHLLRHLTQGKDRKRLPAICQEVQDTLGPQREARVEGGLSGCQVVHESLPLRPVTSLAHQHSSWSTLENATAVHESNPPLPPTTYTSTGIGQLPREETRNRLWPRPSNPPHPPPALLLSSSLTAQCSHRRSHFLDHYQLRRPRK